MEIFVELTLILVLATCISFFMRVLKQPLIVGYILTGIFVGPYALNILESSSTLELFSKIGITILLFIVGLNLNPQVIKDVGKVSLITGIGQVIFTSVIGYVIAILLGLNTVAAIYTAIALTFSSTIIILKLLSDKGDVNKLYGRIAIGFLIVQDIIATVILMVVSSLSYDVHSALFVFNILKGFAALAVVFYASKFFIPLISRYAARSQELLFLFTLTWGLGLSSLFYGLGFSVEIGALVAGMTLSMTAYAYEIGARMKPLRDFFIVLFFILLGSQMVLDGISSLILPGVILSLFVLIGNPIIVIVLMNLLGYNKRIGFYAGLTVAQISEFSLILATLAFGIGHISREVLSLITLVGLITIAGSTYLIMYAQKIYPIIRKPLSLLEFRKTQRHTVNSEFDYNAVLFGYDRVGEYFIKALSHIKIPYIVVDYNPRAIDSLREDEVPHMYGDIEDVNFMNEILPEKAKIVISTIPDYHTTKFLLQYLQEKNFRNVVIVTAQTHEEAAKYYELKATYVLMPHHLGSHQASKMIKRFGLERNKYKDERAEHMDHLKDKGLL